MKIDFRNSAAVVVCAGCAWVGVAQAQQGQGDIDQTVPANGVTIAEPGVRTQRPVVAAERPDIKGAETAPEARMAQAFTYQGRLRSGGLPANGLHSMTFDLYDAPVGGALLASFGGLVPVTSGVFTISPGGLGTNVFDGADRYLEIQVGATTLSPRQLIRPAPYAHTADRLEMPYGESADDASIAIYNTTPGGADVAYFQNSGTNNSYIASIFAGVEAFSQSQIGVIANTTDGIGLRANRSSATGTNPAIHGSTSSESSSANAIVGEVTSLTPGCNSTAVRGINNGTGFCGIGVWGSQDGDGYGVYGTTVDGIAVRGGNTSGAGSLFAGIQPGTACDIGGGTTGFTIVESESIFPDAYAIFARQNAPGTNDTPAIYGVNDDDDFFGVGVHGEGGFRGVRGNAYGTGSNFYYGVFGDASAGAAGDCYSIYGATPAGAGTLWAGYFAGNCNVTGTLSKAAGSFKIDHPLDPYNKFLYHSFVESPDMKNIYDGSVVLNPRGQARVVMPDYFQALNADFRYQLTAVGAPMPNLYIATEIQDGVFVIAGGVPGAKVSWQVTGTRQDAFANANRIPVEEWKQGREVGKLLHPTAFGRSAEEGIDRSRELEEANKGNR